MRHEHLLMSETESAKVIDKVDAWCRRTGTNYNKLVIAARVAVSTRSAVRRRRRRLTLETANRLLRTMQGYPQGITKGEHKLRLSTARLVVHVAELPPRVDRTPCGYCGARRDIGCVHWDRFERGSVAG